MVCRRAHDPTQATQSFSDLLRAAWAGAALVRMHLELPTGSGRPPEPRPTRGPPRPEDRLLSTLEFPLLVDRLFEALGVTTIGELTSIEKSSIQVELRKLGVTEEDAAFAFWALNKILALHGVFLD